MPARNVNLTDHLDNLIETGVSSGRYSNASEMVREALRLLEQREQEDRARIEWLRTAAQEGFDALERGDYTALSSGDDVDAFMKEIQDEVSGTPAAGTRA